MGVYGLLIGGVIMEQLVDLIVKFCNWYIESGLAERTATDIVRMVDYCTSVIVPLMYFYIVTIFGE